MKIIIPMAGMGTRMRPHTLTIPKPLIPIAGKSIVKRLVEDISEVTNQKVDEIAFIIGNFGKEVENNLLNIAKENGAEGKIYYQYEALGTAHAILCAKESLKGEVIVAFADTLFRADFKLDETKDAIIWVHKVANPESFGVVKVNEDNTILDFFEKPKDFVSDLAIIGIYYFKDGENLKNELQYLIDNDVKVKGEYQLTDALENMKNKKLIFKTNNVEEWLDCGNKNATVYTNSRVLNKIKDKLSIPKSVEQNNSIIINPCYIGENVKIENSVIGPNVSIENGTIITNSIITNSIIQKNSNISNANITNSMIGNNVNYKSKENELSIGDYTIIE